MKRFVVAAIVAVAFVPTAAARPLLGVHGDGARFTSLTGQRSSTSHMYLGWGQGQTWGSSFDRVFPKLGTAPLVTITTFRWPSKKSVLTPLQIARGAGDPYLIAFNAAIARAARQIFYVRPLGEMTGNIWLTKLP